MGRAMVCALVVASVGTAGAAAADVCVVCSGPDATYRCTVDQANDIGRYRSGDRVLQMLCISELARAGGHTKCRVSRDATGFCAGEPRTIGLAGLEAALAHGSADAPPAPVDGHQTPPAPAQGGPPRTVEELARRTTQASSEQLRKAGEVMSDSASSAASRLERAGDAIGRAAKKSWLCVTSLFNQC